MKKIGSVLFIVLSLAFVIDDAQAAFTQADLAGTWYGSVLSTGGGEVAEKADMVINSLGNYTYNWVESEGDSGTSTGSLIISSIGKITGLVDAESSSELQGVMNIGKDVFVFTVVWEPGVYALHIFARAGSGLATSDLEGTWYDFSLTSGSSEYWETGTTNFDSLGNQSYAWNNSLGDSGTGTGLLNVSSNGLISDPNDLPDTFRGHALSSGKNLAFGVGTGGSGHSLSVHCKSGAPYVAADLEGTWYGYGITSGTDEYIDSEIVTLDDQGNYSSLWASSLGDSDTVTGTLNFSNDGLLSGISTPTLQGFMSSSKDFMVTVETRGTGTSVLTTLFKEDAAEAVNNPPIPPTLSTPTNGSLEISLTPTLATNAFSDPDTGDTHLQTYWEISTSSEFSSTLLQIQSKANLTTLTVPDMTLQENKTYYWRARFYDNNSNVSGWSSVFSFTTLQTQNDINVNGIPDTLENTTADLDADGTTDIQQTNLIKTLNTVIGSGQMGASIKESATITTITEVNSIDPNTISDVARPESMPLGLFSLRAEVANPGDTGNVTIYFSEAAPSGAIWYFYDSINGWTDYSQYATFSSDRKSVNVQLKDGGYGDSDGIANGIIVDPSGFGIASWIKGAITDSSTGQKLTTATISFSGIDLNLNTLLDGNYISMILPGNYSFSVSAPGYTAQVFSNVAVQEAGIVTKDISLSSTGGTNTGGTNLSQTQVSQLYVSIFGRASEGEGNAYWCSNQDNMVTTANTMLNTEPAKAYFGETLNDNQAFIKFIYENTLGKTYTEDPAGVDYWVSELTNGKSKGEVIATLISAAIDSQYAGSAAQNQFNNKVEVCSYTADKINTVPDVNNLTAFVNFIKDVTHNSSTVTTSKASVDAF